jgi:uroporphyrinogen-III decarboxylase
MSPSQGRSKSPKRMLKDLFEMKEGARPLFIPLIYRYASRVSKIPLKEMLSDPASLSRSLTMAQELFEYDGIVTHYDSCLEMDFLARSFEWAEKEAIELFLTRERVNNNASTFPVRSAEEVGKIPVIFDATAQICEVVGRDIPVIGVLNGPVTLVRAILGESLPTMSGHHEEFRVPLGDTQAMVLDHIKAYCNHRVDVIWVIENDWSDMTPDDMEWLKPLYQTFWNVTQYYNVKSVMAFHRYDAGDMERYYSLGSDAVMFGGNQCRDLPLSSLAGWGERHGVCTGLACPYPEGAEGKEHVDSLVSTLRDMGKGFFLSSPCEVPFDTPVEWINAIVDKVRE